MDAVVQPFAKRPKLVWVVFLYCLFAVASGALSFFFIFSGAISVTPGQAAYVRNLSVFDWATIALTATLNLAAAVSLFLLRKIAFYLFAAALAPSLLQTLVHVITTNSVASPGGAIGILISYSISIAICTYAWRLKARGVLV